jgi:hypothetical protein
VCLPLQAIAEIVESPVDSHKWSHHSGVTRCTVAIFDVLSHDAPSELVGFIIQSQGKSSILSPATVPEMLALEVTSRLRAEVSPIPIIFYVTMNKFKGGLMDAVSGL